MKKTLHLVFQTHWDREWYFTFERYRYRLMHVVERAMTALENHEIESFVLDGQTLPLEDYLEACEENDRKRILKLIKEGRMIIGPWYIAMDEFLVHGESIIRNLEIGKKLTEKYGLSQRVGYLPDTFGHIGQMPQILNDFNIDNAIMWRGIDVLNSEFMWVGADDSKLFTVFLVEGYYNTFLNQADYLKAIQAYADRIQKLALTNDLLMTPGGDHLMPILDNIKTRMKEVEKDNLDLELKVSSFESYLKKVQDQLKDTPLQTLKGELRENTRAYILPNVLSTRSYLKQLNQELEDEMIGYIEPLMALSYFNSNRAPFQYIENIWRTILQNQPHDSICGCSIDPVHKENEMRALKAKEMISSVKEGLLDQLQVLPMTFYGDKPKRIDADDRKFSIYNPHPYPFTGFIEGTLWLGSDSNIKDFVIQDSNNNTYKIAIESIKEDRLFVSPLESFPLFRPGHLYKIRAFVTDLKPLTLTMFNVIEGQSLEVSSHIDYNLENELIQVTLNDDGSIHILDKLNHETYESIHKIYSSMDAGDSYNYSKPENDIISYPFLDGEPIVNKSDISQSITYNLVLNQPEGLDLSRKSALDSKTTSTISVKLTLNQGESLIRVHTKINQTAKDQRLRLQFPLGVLLDEHTNDSAFELVKRLSNREESFVAARQKEVPVVVDSSLSMIHGVKNNRGIQFFHRGLHESQMVLSNDFTQLEVTLIRSVSHLSRDDFGSRGGGAGPNLATPDAQAIREHEFDYAFGFINDDISAIDSFKLAQEFRKPPQIQKGYGEIKPSLLMKKNDEIIMTSFRLVRENVIEVRLWNPDSKTKTTKLSSDLEIVSMNEMTLDHRLIESLDSEFTLQQNEIKTIHIQYKSR